MWKLLIITNLFSFNAFGYDHSMSVEEECKKRLSGKKEQYIAACIARRYYYNDRTILGEALSKKDYKSIPKNIFKKSISLFNQLCLEHKGVYCEISNQIKIDHDKQWVNINCLENNQEFIDYCEKNLSEVQKLNKNITSKRFKPSFSDCKNNEADHKRFCWAKTIDIDPNPVNINDYFLKLNKMRDAVNK